MNIEELLTPGMLLLAAGIALFVLAVVLIIVFCLRPPRYRPENEAVAMAGSGQTQPLRSGYQTSRLSAGRGGRTAAPSAVQAVRPTSETAPPAASGAPAAPPAAWQGALAEQPPAPGTVALSQSQPETAVLSRSQPETEVLPPQARP